MSRTKPTIYLYVYSILPTVSITSHSEENYSITRKTPREEAVSSGEKTTTKEVKYFKPRPKTNLFAMFLSVTPDMLRLIDNEIHYIASD